MRPLSARHEGTDEIRGVQFFESSLAGLCIVISTDCGTLEGVHDRSIQLSVISRHVHGLAFCHVHRPFTLHAHLVRPFVVAPRRLHADDGRFGGRHVLLLFEQFLAGQRVAREDLCFERCDLLVDVGQGARRDARERKLVRCDLVRDVVEGEFEQVASDRLAWRYCESLSQRGGSAFNSRPSLERKAHLVIPRDGFLEVAALVLDDA